MREIKFRAWDGVKWIYSTTIKRDENARNWMIYDLTNSEWVYCSEPKQYTGLKDKNGREIYEGDVVEFCDFDSLRTGGNTSDNVLRGKVFYGCCMYLIEIDKENDIHFDLFQAFANDDELEIIGNVYENPELLEVIP